MDDFNKPDPAYLDDPKEKGKSPTRWILRGVIFMFLLVAVVLGYALYLMGPTGTVAEIRIPKSSGAAEVGRILEQAGLVRSGSMFVLYLRFSGQDKELKPGYFRLEGMGLRTIALAITDESNAQRVRVTFPEGWRAVDMAQRLTENNLDGPRFLQLVKTPPAELRPAEARGPTLEGFLFPATYDFPLDYTAEDVIRAMTRRMEQEFTPEVRERLKQVGLDSVHDWITLASIVQAEAAGPSEKPVIAGVFLNRLEINMPLQADPTVAYGLGIRLPELDRRAGHFEKDTPFNTYTRRGLPPGAIGSPGAEALHAVLNPVRINAQGQNYLFFLHAQGRLFLNTDFQGHLRDVTRYHR